MTKRNLTDIKPNAEPQRHLGPHPAIGLLSTTLDNVCVLPLAHFTAHEKNGCAQFRDASNSLSNINFPIRNMLCLETQMEQHII